MLDNSERGFESLQGSLDGGGVFGKFYAETTIALHPIRSLCRASIGDVPEVDFMVPYWDEVSVYKRIGAFRSYHCATSHLPTQVTNVACWYVATASIDLPTNCSVHLWREVP